MLFVQTVITNAPEIFLFLAVAVGTFFGRVRVHGFALGSTACILIVAVVLGQLGAFVIPPVLKSIFFAFFVFTIGFRSGPEFFASLSFRTMTQVVLALVIGATGLFVVLIFAFALHLEMGTAAGLAAGALTQSSVIGTATGALQQLGLPDNILQQEQANIAAGYAVTYVCGYILVLFFVPFVAPRLMRVNLKEEAVKLEAELSGGDTSKKEGNLIYRKVQARAYRISTAAGRTVGEIERQVGRRAVIERIVRDGQDVESAPDTKLQVGDEILLAGPTAAIIAARSFLGSEIEGEGLMRSISGESVQVLVSARDLHGRTLEDIVNRLGDQARGVFLRSLTRQRQEVPIAPGTRIYVGDVMTLVGVTQNVNRVLPKVGQALRVGDRTDVAFLGFGLAVGLFVGVLSYTVGSVPLNSGRRRRRVNRRPGLWMAACPPADCGRDVSCRATNPHRHRAGWIHRCDRFSEWSGSLERNPGSWVDASRSRCCCHPHSHDRRHIVRISHFAHEPRDHLRGSCRRNDG